MSAGAAASPWLILIMNRVVSNATTTKTMMLALASDILRMTFAAI